MNDERIVSQVIHAGKVSGDFLLKTLWLLIEKSSSYVAYRNSNKVYVGDTSWNKFLATSGDKDIKTFLTSELNLIATSSLFHITSLKQVKWRFALMYVTQR